MADYVLFLAYVVSNFNILKDIYRVWNSNKVFIHL